MIKNGYGILPLLAEFDDHEMILDLGEDFSSPLSGFIAIHNRTLGPALGGTRIFPYSHKKEALADVLRLSRAMTYKCAIAGLPFGGGKGVIIAKPGADLAQSLKFYAQKVSELQGKFYTGEDVGLSEEEVQYMLGFSPFFIGKSGQAGDPSPFCALSSFKSMEVALAKVFGDANFAGRRCAIKGLGKTGGELAKLLLTAGAEVIVADIDAVKIHSFLEKYPQAKIADPEEIDRLPSDIYAPCALGCDITRQNIDQIQAPIIVGTANNQLQSPEIGERLFHSGILHIPDYIANAGGLINVADELLPGGYQRERVMQNIDRLMQTLNQVLLLSENRSASPTQIADKMVEAVIAQKAKVTEKVPQVV